MSKGSTVLAIGALVLLLTPTSPAAQTVQGGIVGGMSFTTLQGFEDIITDGPKIDTKSRLNYLVGIFVKANLSNWFAFQPEVLYARKGAELALTGLFTESIKYNLNYIDFPLLARFQTGRGSGFYVVVGPSIGLNVAAKVEDPAGETEDVKDDVNSSEIGLVVGAGVDLAHFVLEGRYTRGLSDIVKDQAPDAPADVSIENRAFSILFGIRF